MSTNDIGTTIAIATGAPATIDQAGFEALTFVAVNGLVSVGEVGDDQETITIPDVTAGRNRTIKGVKTGTTIAIALREVPADAGQAAAKTASDALGGEHSLRITEPGGTIQYIAGPVTGWKRNERSTTSYAGFTYNITTNYADVSV